ncbi:MAG: glycosyltransferase [Clostridia bacterium]|nr:glycosyltransferase [Clostridia bacterium]
MKFSLCIPMYNEAGIIQQTAKTLSEYMEANFEDYEIIFSNDGSHDGCDKLVEQLGLPNVKVVGYEQNMGKGYAVRLAMLNAEGDVVMFTDADLAYGVDVIKRVADTFADNPDAKMLIGSRNLAKDGYENYTFMRKLASKAYIKVLCIIGGFNLSDSQCGCKAFRGEAVKPIFSRCEVNRFAFDFECILLAKKLGYKIIEMPVKVINHRESTVRMVRDSVKMLGDILKMKKRIKRLEIK